MFIRMYSFNIELHPACNLMSSGGHESSYIYGYIKNFPSSLLLYEQIES